MYIRKSTKEDLPSLIKLLSQLTTVGNPINIDSKIYQNIYVGIINENIVGTITLLIEPKIIHNGSKVGHIEDVVVDSDHRKMGIGMKLIEYAVEIAKQEGCYKVILDCDTENTGFYNKCGFKTKGVCMRLDF